MDTISLPNALYAEYAAIARAARSSWLVGAVVSWLLPRLFDRLKWVMSCPLIIKTIHVFDVTP